MRTNLRKLALPLALAGAIGAAPAFASTGLSVQDRGFDYADASTETAYFSLAGADGSLVLTVDDQASANSLPGIDVVVPDLGREDFFGSDIGAELSDISALSFRTAGSVTTGFEVTHASTTLSATQDAYMSALQAAGFDVLVADGVSANFAVLTGTSATGSVRVTLHRAGADVEASLVTL